MKSLNEIMRSHKRFDILGGRTLEENHAFWAEKRKGAPPEGPQVLAEDCDLATHLRRCSVPDRLAEIIVRGEDPTEAVKVAKRWIEGDASFLLLHGETGAGKSLAAATIFKASRKTVRWEGGEQPQWNSHECWMMGATDLARSGYYGEEGAAIVEHMKRVRLLVLDDLGAESLSAPYLSLLDDVVDARFSDRRKRTAMTTNVSASRRPESPHKPSPFEERYGARISRRIRESGMVVRCEGGKATPALRAVSGVALDRHPGEDG